MIALTASEPPHEAAHWTARAMAAATGISASSVRRIWRAHHLRPHRVRTFKLAKDPAFATKLRDIVGLYLDPPRHAVVLSVDEKPRIQPAQQVPAPSLQGPMPGGIGGALDRTQPGLPVVESGAFDGPVRNDDPRRRAPWHHDLVCALNVLDGTVLGRCMHRHRHQEFLRFLNAIEATVPAGGKLIHCILDNYGTHKHPKVLA